MEGNHRTVCVVRWPERVAPGKSDGMMHVVDWFPTVMSIIEIGKITSETLSLAKSYLQKQEIQATYLEARVSDYDSVGSAILNTVHQQL